MKARDRLGDLELLVMKILWDTNEPLDVKEVTKRLGNTRAYTTVMTTLNRLYRKGYLKQEKHSRSFLYSPLVSQNTFLHQTFSRIAEYLFSGNLGRLVPYVLGLDKKMTEEEIKTLQEICKRIEDIDD